MKWTVAAIAALLAVGVAPAWSEARLELSFCPAKAVRTYPLADQQGVDGLVLQNVAIINKGDAPIALARLDLELLQGGDLLDERHFAGDALKRLAASGPAVQGSGMMELAPFQFCGTAMIAPGVKLTGPTLAPNEAMLVMYQPMAYRGARDMLRIRVAGLSGGGVIEAVASLPILSGFAKNSYIFPLKGAWYVGVGPTPHSGHRWAIPEEFAFDIARIGEGGVTHRGDGTRFTDYYAYGAEVLATADGRVIASSDGLAEDTTAMRRPDETVDAYFQRLLGEQAQRMADGAGAILGNFVMIDHGQGEYSMSAHLKPGSVRVKAGDQITQGQVIGDLGSSGNSTEPHLHFQLCDGPDPVMCAGIPVQFTNIEIPWADGSRPLQSGDVAVTR